MLVFRILATVFMGVSCITVAVKNISIFAGSNQEIKHLAIWTIYGWIWRAFVIVAIWLI